MVGIGNEVTYSAGGTGADVVAEAGNVAWVSHEDGGLDLRNGCCCEWDSSAGDALVGVSTAAESVVEDLTTLHNIVSLFPAISAE